MRRAAEGQRGHTLAEAIVYLAIVGVFTGTMVSTQMLTRQLASADAARLQRLDSIDRLHRSLLEDFDGASAVRVTADGVVHFDGGRRYSLRADDHIVERDGDDLIAGVESFEVARDPDGVGLYQTTVRLTGTPDADTGLRTFRRAFVLRNSVDDDEAPQDQDQDQDQDQEQPQEGREGPGADF